MRKSRSAIRGSRHERSAIAVRGFLPLLVAGMCWHWARRGIACLSAFWVNDVTDSPRMVQLTGTTMWAPLLFGGAMGGVLGPADALYQELGVTLANSGIGLIRVGYRVPNDTEKCVHDLVAAADLATRSGARRFITMGHSFGGAPALQAAVILQEHCAGVVTLATQSAGCEPAEDLATRVPVILFHGDKDEILPLQASELVRMVIGGGELVPLPGAGHLLAEATDELRDRLTAWIPEKFEAHIKE